MAEDIGRLLSGEPVLARRTSLAERAVKALRRHPRMSLLGGVLLTLILGLVIHTAISRERLAQEVQMQRAMIVGLLVESDGSAESSASPPDG